MAGRKKDFTGISTGVRVAGAIEQATSARGQQGNVTPQEAAERAEKMQTQGRKGCKAVRINMAFSPANYDFVHVMARATGQTMTQFVNQVIDAYQKEHPEIMAQAQAFVDMVNAMGFSNGADD